MIREYEYTGNAMGTEFSIAILCDFEDLAERLASEAKVKIHAYETQFSRFLPESELSRLNNVRNAIVSENFLAVVEESYALFVKTKGAFNPLVQIERLGYNKSFDARDDTHEALSSEPYNINFSETLIDPTERRIILAEGQKLDFGGFLKGYLAEILCREIQDSSPLVTGVIVNIGGDIHTRGADAHGAPFVFQIYNPVLKNTDLSVPLSNASLATSGTYKRTWKNNGVRVHHILDVAGTHNPNTDIVSTSVIHSRGGAAEAYAKVFLSRGEAATVELLHPETLSYILIKNNGDVIKNIL